MAAGLTVALVLAGCGTDGPTKQRPADASSDSGDARDVRPDTVTADLPPFGGDGATDRSDGGTDSGDATVDRPDSSTAGTGGSAADSGTGGTGTGGMGSGGMGTGGSGVGGMGTGGTGIGGMGTGGSGVGGTGTGGTGTGGTGTGGAGTGGAAGDADAGTDIPVDSGDSDVPVDTGGSGGATGGPDASSDTADAGCGPGCPSNFHPEALSIWLASDNGVQCNPTTMRVAAWTNRGNLGDPFLVGGHSGPLCASDVLLGGRPVLGFDPTGLDDDEGVFRVDLTPLVGGGGYTVFVVERRRSPDEGYVLGTTLPVAGTSCSTDPDNPGGIAYKGYRLGYDNTLPPPLPTYLFAGPYLPAPSDNRECDLPLTPPPAFSSVNPQAALDVEVFDLTAGHTLFSNGVKLWESSDTTPIVSLGDGYIGRAFQALNANTRHSRFHGDIAEIVIYAASLTSTEVQDVSNYLAARWGLTLAH